MYEVYILESKETGRWYIGSTSNVKKRLVSHNAGRVTSTKPYRPYRLVYRERHETKREALAREKQIKQSGYIRQSIRHQIKQQGPIV